MRTITKTGSVDLHMLSHPDFYGCRGSGSHACIVSTLPKASSHQPYSRKGEDIKASVDTSSGRSSGLCRMCAHEVNPFAGFVSLRGLKPERSSLEK